MFQMVENGSAETTTRYGTLSDLIIPAVPGEFYAYSSEFTGERPLYALMKCKANKNRPVKQVEALGREANLLFLFGGEDQSQVQVCAVNAAQHLGLLNDGPSFDETRIAVAGITLATFRRICLQKNVEELVRVCRSAWSQHETFITLLPGSVVAMMTDEGKYGLFFVKEVGQASVKVDACHILL